MNPEILLLQPITKVLVGVSFEEDGDRLTAGSQRALRQAEWLAWTGGEATLVHSKHGERAVDPESTHEIVHEGPTSARLEVLEEEATRLRDVGLRAELAVRREEPYEALIREAHERNADLVLVGKHESSRRSHLGSVARALIRECPVPVWVLKPTSNTVPEVIVAATDLTPTGAVAVAHASLLARRSGAELHLLHAYALDMAAQMHPGDGSEEQVRALATAAVQDQSKSADAPASAILHVTRNSPVRAILGADEALQPDLVVLGSISRGGLPGLLLGNTAESVLPKLSSSLLTVKPPEFRSRFRD